MIAKFLLTFLLLATTAAQALTADEARKMAVGEAEDRAAAVTQALQTADGKTSAFIQALSDDAVKIAGDKVFGK